MGCRVRGGGFLLLVQRDRDEVLSSRGRFGHVLVDRRELEPGRLSSRSLTKNDKTKRDMVNMTTTLLPECSPIGDFNHKIHGQKLWESIFNIILSSNTLLQKTNKQASRKITENCFLWCRNLSHKVLGWIPLTVRVLYFFYNRWSVVLTVFSPLQAGSFGVTGSHGSPSSHLGYAENHYLTLERDLPEI